MKGLRGSGCSCREGGYVGVEIGGFWIGVVGFLERCVVLEELWRVGFYKKWRVGFFEGRCSG